MRATHNAPTYVGEMRTSTTKATHNAPTCVGEMRTSTTKATHNAHTFVGAMRTRTRQGWGSLDGKSFQVAKMPVELNALFHLLQSRDQRQHFCQMTLQIFLPLTLIKQLQ